MTPTKSNFQEITTEGWRVCILSLLFALIPLCLIWQGKATQYGLEMDEGMLLVYPQLILEGSLPHKDFETFYTPGNLWVLAGVYQLFGNTIESARTVGLLFHIALVTAIFFLSAGRVAGGFAALAAGILLSPLGLTPFAWLLAMVLILWACVLCVRTGHNGGSVMLQKVSPFFVGLLAGLAVLVRQDAGLAMLALLGALWIWNGFRSMLMAVCGVLIALLPLGVHLLQVGWQPLWDNLIAYPIVKTRGARGMPFSEATNAQQTLILASFLAVLQAGACFFLSRKASKETGDSCRVARKTVILWPVLFLTLSHQMLQRADWIHVAFVAFFPIAMMIPCLLVISKMRIAMFLKMAGSVPGLIAFLLIFTQAELRSTVAAGFARAFTDESEGFPVESSGRKFYMRSEGQQAVVQETLNFLNANAKPGERLVVGAGDFSKTVASDTFFYHLLSDKLEPGTYFLEFNPGSANREGTRLAADVAAANWVILNGMYRRWDEPNDSGKPVDLEANRIFETNYRAVFKSGPYEVYWNAGVKN